MWTLQQTLWNVLAGGVIKNPNSLNAVAVELIVRGKSRPDSEIQFQNKQTKKKSKNQDPTTLSFIPALGRKRQTDVCELEVACSTIASSRTGSEAIEQKQKTKTKKKTPPRHIKPNHNSRSLIG